jgi:regulatory protein
MAGPPDHKPVTARWMMNAAQAYVTRFAATERHVAAVLARKIRKRTGAAPEPVHLAMIRDVVASLTRARLIDDSAFAAGRTQTLKRKGLPANRALAALTAKGVERELAAASVEAAVFDEVEQAVAAAKRLRIGPWARDPAARDADKDMARLARRGFSRRAVMAAFRRGEEGETAGS